MLSVEEARARILGGLAPTPAEAVALPEGWGRVLARPILARLTQPPADVSAMDGYAVRAADAVLGARLEVVGSAPAGHPYAGSVGPGQAVRIFTGAFIRAARTGSCCRKTPSRPMVWWRCATPCAPAAGSAAAAWISRKARR